MLGPVDRFPVVVLLFSSFLSAMKLNWIHNCIQFSDFGFFSVKILHDYHDCKSVLTRFDIGMHIHVLCFIFQQFKTSMHINVTYNSMLTMSLKSEDLINKKNVQVSRYCSLCYKSYLTVTQWYAVHGHFPFRHITASIYKACTLLAVGMLLFPLAFQT